MKLYNLYTSPPGGWRWVVPETGVPMEGRSFQELVEKTRQHYAANGFSYGRMLADHVEEGIVRFLQQNKITGYCPPAPPTVEEFAEPLLEPEGVEVGNDVARIKELLR